MMYPPPPPPPREKSFSRAILMTLATTVFGLSLAANVYLLMLSGVLSDGGSREAMLVEGDPNQKVAVVPLNGVIMTEQSMKFDRFIRQVEHDDTVKAIVIEVDSPGGSVTASDEIYQRILRFKTNRPGVPVVVSMGSLATSGGYYVACAADQVFAQPTTMTGNIGVLLPRFNVHKLMQEWGIEETTIESTGATFKNAGSMFKPEKPEETQYLQDIADNAFAQFKQVVVNGRGKKLTQPIDQIANGKVYLTDEALALGLIDQSGYPSDAYAYAATQAGLGNPQVVRYQDPPTLLDLLSAQSNVPASAKSSGGVTVNGVNVNVDSGMLHELMTPRLMYLWRGQ